MRTRFIVWLYMFLTCGIMAVVWAWNGVYPLALICTAGAYYAAYRLVRLETE